MKTPLFDCGAPWNKRSIQKMRFDCKISIKYYEIVRNNIKSNVSF